MADEEERLLENQLAIQLLEQRDSLAAVNEALAAEPSNTELLSVHEELITAIKDAEEGLFHLKRARLLREADLALYGSDHAFENVKAEEPLDPTHRVSEALENPSYPVGSNCRFLYTDGRWYNGQIVELQGSNFVKVSFLSPTSEIMTMCQFFLQGRCRFGGDCRFSHGVDVPLSALRNYVPAEEESYSSSDQADSNDGEEENSQGLGFLETTARQSGIQTETVIFAKWENHTRGIASKMMVNMGYREGMGLGISGQGMLDPILAKVLPPKQSLEHALQNSKDGEHKESHGKKRSRGGKRKRGKKFAAKAKEEENTDVFSLINNQLAMHGENLNKGLTKKQQKTYPENRKVDRRALVAYNEEINDLRARVEKLEEMMSRNINEKAVYESAMRKLNETRKTLAETEEAHASTSNAVVSKEKEKKWLKF